MDIPNLNERNIQAFDVSRVRPDVAAGTRYLVYAPLSGSFFVADSDGLAALEASAADPRSATGEMASLLERIGDRTLYDELLADENPVVVKNPSHYTRLSLLPTLRCNFHCSYCYSAKGRASTEIDSARLDTMVDWFMDDRRTECRERTIFISGGGEPLMSWQSVRRAVERSRKLEKENRLNLTVLLMTNGSLLTASICDFLKANGVEVGLSFDILPQVQNLQRGHYQQVVDNLRMMVSRGLEPTVSSVITPANIGLMMEMAVTMHRDFPDLRHLNFDPAMGMELYADAIELDSFYDKFIVNFFETKRFCAQHGMTMDCNALRHAMKLFPRYCQGKLCLVPNGDISVCHSVSSPRETGYDDFVYGRVGDGRVVFDEPKFLSLIGSQDSLPLECRRCIARWHCGGGCLMYRRAYDDSRLAAVCRYTQNMTATILLKRMGDAV